MDYLSNRKAEPVIAGQTVIQSSPLPVENLNVEDPTIQLASNDDPTHQSGISQDHIEIEENTQEKEKTKSVGTPAEDERKITSNEWTGTGDQTQSANVIPNVQIDPEQILIS